ncbi:MAG: GtrA family protein [Bacteroidetes bacterium]|nr:GtrA family protein [Bacteroidota bacterium]
MGGLCFALDFGIYYGLSEGAGVPTVVAKSISVVLATLLNYYLNKSWTWGQSNRDSKRLARYMALYVVSGLMNVASNELFLNILPDNEFQMLVIYTDRLVQTPFLTLKLDKFLAVIGATLVGMMVNFLGQKLWVFKSTPLTFPLDAGDVK